MSIFSIFIASLIGENIVLTKFFGIDTFLNREDEEKNIIGISISLLFVVLISVLLTYLVNKYILIPTTSLELQPIIFILIIISLIQFTDIIIKKYFNKLYKALKINLPLMVANTAIFGIILNTINMDYNLLNSIIYALGSSLGFILIMYIITNIDSKIRNNDIIKSFKGLPIMFITLGLIALIIGRII